VDRGLIASGKTGLTNIGALTLSGTNTKVLGAALNNSQHHHAPDRRSGVQLRKLVRRVEQIIQTLSRHMVNLGAP